MSTLNANPDASDMTTHAADGLYAPIPSVADVAVSTPTTLPEQGSSGHWSDGLRGAARDNPYVVVGAAALLGMLLVRLTR